MSTVRRSKLLFVLAALFFVGTVVCGYLWLDQQALADEIAMRGHLTKEDRASRRHFEKNAREWRTLALVGAVLASGAIAAGVIRSRRAGSR